MVTALDKNTALVLIDLQNGIVNLPMAHPVQNILATSAMLVAAFRKANLPIVIVNVNPSGTPPAEWLEIAPEILTQPTDVFITKRTWSAFFDTALDEQLKAKGVTDIVLAGISTSIGVEGTARDASRLGYNIAFATDAMTDMAASAHEHSQKIIFPRLGEVDTTDKIIELL